MKSRNILGLIIAIGVSELAGVIGSVFTVNAISTWYATLHKAALNPPPWIFGPVWTTLYILMGVAAFLVWKIGSERRDVKNALGVFGLQLLLNTAWSIIFFGFHNIGGGLIDIELLWLMILLTMVLFFKLSKTAGWLLVPYILWVSFASYLNYSVYILNR